MMRVLVVTQYFWPENFRINDLVEELVRRGHVVTVLTGQPNYPEGVILPAYRAAPASFGQYAGAEIVRVPLIPRGRGAARMLLNYSSFVVTGTVMGAWKLRHRTFDVIFHFQASPVTAALPAVALSALTRAPLFLWILDLWPETLSAVGVVKSPRVLALVGRMVGFIYRRCQLVLAQSRAFADNVRRLSGDDRRFRYFPSWAESLFAGPLADVALAAELAPYAATFNVLFAGNIGEAQDFPSILAAAEATRHRTDIRWLIVGDGRAAAWVRDEIQRRGLAETVVMFGRHPLERMPSFFRGASALLVSLKADPGFAMTIPGKVQSYMSAGVPVLGMLDGEGARVIDESGAGLTCRAGDGAGLAARVLELAAMSEEARSAMGARGKQYTALEFDRDTLMHRFEAWMQEVAVNSPSGATSGRLR